MKRVYIAGKLNSDAVGYIKNVHSMIKTAEAVRRQGFAVLIPCLDLLSGLVFGTYEYEDYFNNNQEFLKVCDAVFVCPNSEASLGTKMEIDLAHKMGIPVFHHLESMIEDLTEKKEAVC